MFKLRVRLEELRTQWAEVSNSRLSGKPPITVLNPNLNLEARISTYLLVMVPLHLITHRLPVAHKTTTATATQTVEETFVSTSPVADISVGPDRRPSCFEKMQTRSAAKALTTTITKVKKVGKPTKQKGNATRGTVMAKHWLFASDGRGSVRPSFI